MIDGLDQRIEQALGPSAGHLNLLRTIPGIGERAAQGLISELGWTCPGSPPRRTWPPGPACAPATTNPPASTNPAAPAKATPKSATSSPNAPGRPARPTAT